MRIQGFAKLGYSCSDGTIGLVIRYNGKEEIFFFNSDKARKIVGITDYLSCWLSNNLRVFAPVVVDIYDETVEVQFTQEDVVFVCARAEKPNLKFDIPIFKEEKVQ